MPDIKVTEYVQDEYGFIQTDENGENILRQKTPEELAWEARMAKKAAEAELAKVPFDRVPSVTVSGSAFVLTGDFEKAPEDRDEVKRLIEARGGRCTGSISGKTNYLVVGALGGFGQRKIEQVQEQRAKGKTIKIIREADLMAALSGRKPSAPPKPAPKPSAPPKPAPKPAPKAAPPKPAPSAPKAPASRTLASEPDFRMEEVPPKDGESARFRVTFSLDGLSGGAGGGSPKPTPSKPASKAPSKPAGDTGGPSPEQARIAAYDKAVDELKQAVEKAIQEGREAVARQTEEVRKVQEKRNAVEKKLRSLGLFAFSAKKEAREELSRADRELSEARQKEGQLKGEAWKKAEETLEKYSRLLPPVPTEGCQTGKKMAKGASAEVLEKARMIETVLSIVPQTAEEINDALRTDYTALQIANAVKFICGAGTTKVFRIKTTKSGDIELRQQTAYYTGINF